MGYILTAKIHDLFLTESLAYRTIAKFDFQASTIKLDNKGIQLSKPNKFSFLGVFFSF